MFARPILWRKSLAAILILAFFASALAACGGATPTGTTAAPTTAAATGPAKPTGVLRVGVSQLSRETLDPFVDPGSGDLLISLIFDSVIGTTPDGMDLGPVGGLATKWEQKPDASGWTFYLRKGVQWDKGYGEVTAEDVKYSLERTIFKEGASTTDKGTFVAGIKEIVVVDPYTVRIDTNSAFVDLPDMISRLQTGNGALVPRKAIEQMGEKQWQQNPVASGPYRMVEHQPGSFFKFEAREDYWGGAPRYKEVIVYNVPEDATRAAMLKRGELDVAEVTIPQLKELETAGFQTVEKKDGQEYLAFVHNQWEGALAKKEVRQALNLAVNRKELAETLFGGRARPNNGDSPSYLLGGKAQPPIPYDPDQAKKLLAQAGYPNGFDLGLISRPQAPLPILAEALAGYYKAVGINATLKPMDVPSATALWREGKLKDTLGPFNSSNRRFFLSGYASRFSAKGSVTLVRDIDPQLEAILTETGKSKTVDEMAKNQARIQQYVLDQHREVFLLHGGRWFAASPKVNVKGWNGGGMPTFNIGLFQLIGQK